MSKKRYPRNVTIAQTSKNKFQIFHPMCPEERVICDYHDLYEVIRAWAEGDESAQEIQERIDSTMAMVQKKRSSRC
jgi:hypothetical protein